MKDQMLKMAKVKSEKEFYKKYPSEEAFMKAHGKAFKKAAMGSKMVNDQLHQLTDFGNPPIAQIGGKYNKYLQGTNQPGLNPDGSIKQVGDAFNNASMAQYSGQQTASQMSAQYAPPSSDKLMGINDINSGAAKAGGGVAGAAMAGLNALPAIIGGIEAIGAQNKAKSKANQSAQLSGLASQAATTREKVERKYVRPEDSLVQPGQLGNPYGSGTNYLAAQNGTMIGGNPTEIQNTYTPGDLYSDLGYEPMEKAYKQYRHGGDLPKAELGEYFQDSGQAQIGGAVGEAAGTALFGPLGGMAGKILGQVGGNLLGGAKDARELKKYQDQTAMNTQQAAWQNQLQSGQFSKSMEHGGYMNPEYNPQVIAKFGDYSVKDLLKPPYDADMLRSGGHLAQVPYTPPSAAAMFTGRPDMPQAEYGTQMAMGGELEVGDGGRLETLSYNPNLPGGEIGMFRGASHDNGGIKTKYGENEVEVEGGEPAVKLQDGGSSENLVVFGNIKINKEIADLMGDPKAKGKKFKTYIADVAKNDAKQLKRINKGLELIEEYKGNSSYDKLGMNSGMANLMGGKAHQKINAEKIKEAGIVQDAIHQTASQLGVKSDKLAEGKLEQETDPSMVAKNGINMETAQFGKSFVDRYNKQNKQKKQNTSARPKVNNSEVYNPPTFVDLTVSPNNPTANVWTGSQNLPSPNIKTGYDESGNYFDESGSLVDPSGGFEKNSPVDKLFSSDQIAKGTFAGRMLRGLGKGFEKYGETALSNLAPFLRPTNANQPLNPDQLTPEYYALATNQLDPVQAQTYQPMLDTPYDISFNDQLNAVDSQARAAIRAAGSNPAAQAQIMSQALEAKNRVLGEQSRINQTNKMQTYSKNRDLLNDAQLKNLAILDQQYVRQSQAKSNTRTQALEALKSIAAKTAQNRLENKQLATYENMYNYRFSPSGVAYNVNAPAQFNIPGVGNINATNEQQAKMKDYWEKVVSKDKSGNVTGSKEKTSTSKTGRNGSIVQSLKTL